MDNLKKILPAMVVFIGSYAVVGKLIELLIYSFGELPGAYEVSYFYDLIQLLLLIVVVNAALRVQDSSIPSKGWKGWIEFSLAKPNTKIQLTPLFVGIFIGLSQSYFFYKPF